MRQNTLINGQRIFVMITSKWPWEYFFRSQCIFMMYSNKNKPSIWKIRGWVVKKLKSRAPQGGRRQTKNVFRTLLGPPGIKIQAGRPHEKFADPPPYFLNGIALSMKQYTCNQGEDYPVVHTHHLSSTTSNHCDVSTDIFSPLHYHYWLVSVRVSVLTSLLTSLDTGRLEFGFQLPAGKAQVGE